MESSTSHAVENNARFCTTKGIQSVEITKSYQLVCTLGLSYTIIRQGRLFTNSELILILCNYREYGQHAEYICEQISSSTGDHYIGPEQMY